MRAAILLFSSGIFLTQHLPALPPMAGLLAVAGGAALLAAIWLRYRRPAGRRWLAGVLLGLVALLAGVCWAGWRAELRLAEALPMQLEGRDLWVQGVVDELPQRLEGGLRFVLRVEHGSLEPVPDGVSGREEALALPGRILLSWYADRQGVQPVPALRPGERWQLRVRLKRPQGLSNPQGFDYEAWLLERGLRASGHVRRDEANRLLGVADGALMLRVHALRHAVRERFEAVLGDSPHVGVVSALAIGDQRSIARAQWEVFRRTGVNHLVAISGLHVSLVALCAGGVVGLLWRRVPALSLRLASRRAGVLAALVAASGYALLAGMGIPVQRALIMLWVAGGMLLGGRELAASRGLALALGAVLVVDPWAVLSAGFWLSFAAVGVILLVLGGRVVPMTGWRAAVHIQLAISLALIPALLVLFNAFSIVAPLANALAIPLVSFLITPLALLAAVVPIDALLLAADQLTGVMMSWLEWLAVSPLAVWQQARPPLWLVLTACAALAVVLLPGGTPARPAAALCLLPLLGWSPERPQPGHFVATVLDVGQGQAVHVQTAAHDLLFDAGPMYGRSADAGERVVLPYLDALGVTRLDALVLSHGDADHAGGAASVLGGRAVALLYGALPAGLPAAALPGRQRACHAGPAWEWDGVRFEILHPRDAAEAAVGDNERSCVLRVEAGGHSVLLTSDIERAGEQSLLAAGSALASTVVVAPHHGSRTSSTPALVAAVAPRHVVYSVGYRNPFGHPHPQVWARWAGAGAQAWRTDSQGAIRIEAGGSRLQVDAHRLQAPRYWHGR